MAVTIGEDATRVVTRAEYDSETDCCVGLVLPLTKNGLPIVDSLKLYHLMPLKECFWKKKLQICACIHGPATWRKHTSILQVCL